MNKDHIPQNTEYTVVGIIIMGIVLSVVASVVLFGLDYATIGLV